MPARALSTGLDRDTRATGHSECEQAQHNRPAAAGSAVRLGP